MRKAFLAIVVLALFFVLNMFSLAFADVVSSGECGVDGKNVTWTFDNNGTLTISGTGKMNMNMNDLQKSSWINAKKITNIVIQDGVTNISERAFEGCVNLVSITIPDSVINIEGFSFVDCSSLTSITIPSSVTNIGRRSFLFCNSLKNITIMEGVRSIGESAFCGCNNLTSITFPSSITNIEPKVFYSCQNLKDIYYNGNESEWKKISIAIDNKHLLNATIHFVDKQSNNQINIILNGKSISFPQAPYMANDTTMVPMRAIFEALDAAVEYDAGSQKITATKGDTVIELVLGEKAAKKNGEGIALDAPAVTKNGNTMVPLRFVAESLQAQVDWDNASQTITITLE